MRGWSQIVAARIDHLGRTFWAPAVWVPLILREVLRKEAATEEQFWGVEHGWLHEGSEGRVYFCGSCCRISYNLLHTCFCISILIPACASLSLALSYFALSFICTCVFAFSAVYTLFSTNSSTFWSVHSGVIRSRFNLSTSGTHITTLLLCFVHRCFCLFWFDFGIGHFSVQLGVPWLRRFVVKTCPGGPGVVRDCLIEDSSVWRSTCFSIISSRSISSGCFGSV